MNPSASSYSESFKRPHLESEQFRTELMQSMYDSRYNAVPKFAEEVEKEVNVTVLPAQLGT